MRTELKYFKALSDSSRLRILKMLEVRPLCVCEITEILKLAASTVSKHLSILRDANLILDSKEGKWVNYELNRAPGTKGLEKLMELVADLLPDDGQIQSDAEIARSVDRNRLCSL